jgi:hypothetical protein
MKKLMVLIIVLLAIKGLIAQVQSDCTVPQELAYHWMPDIRHLALCRIYEIQSPDTVFVRIPAIYCDTIARGMAGIVNARSVIPEADTVFNKYCVHNIFGCVSIDYSYIVSVDTSYSWTESWQNLQTMTGDPLMDTILSRYNLHVIDFHYWTNSCVAVLYTDSIWNMYALCDSLEMVDGVNIADVNSMNMDADKIDYYVIDGERFYDFSMEWGDCMSGCTSHYVWKFKVGSDCEVTYLGLEANLNDPFPSPDNCDFFNAIQDYNLQKTIVFPNPSKDNITISSPAIERDTQLSIFNVSGEKVIERPLINTETQIDISALARGVYFVRLQNEKMVEVGKMVKE